MTVQHFYLFLIRMQPEAHSSTLETTLNGREGLTDSSFTEGIVSIPSIECELLKGAELKGSNLGNCIPPGLLVMAFDSMAWAFGWNYFPKIKPSLKQITKLMQKLHLCYFSKNFITLNFSSYVLCGRVYNWKVLKTKIFNCEPSVLLSENMNYLFNNFKVNLCSISWMFLINCTTLTGVEFYVHILCMPSS